MSSLIPIRKPRLSVHNPGLVYPAAVAFSVSAATLLLQLVQTRIYSVVFWNHLVYFIISIALLGFGISGTWLSFGKDKRLARLLTLRNAAVGCVISIIVSCLIMPRVAPSLATAVSSSPQLLQLLLTYVVAVLPYFFAGWMLGTIFRDYAPWIHVLYAADLVGACLGCLIFLAAIQMLGAINLVLMAAALVLFPVLLHDIRLRSNAIGMGIMILLIVGISWFEPTFTQAIRPEPAKAFNTMYTNRHLTDFKKVELTEWNTISRIDVVSTTKMPNEKLVFIDGDAFTGLVVNPAKWVTEPFDPQRDPMMGDASPFFFRNGDNLRSVLIIGTGGGSQVYLALRGGAKLVDAVEINPTTWRLPLLDYREQTRGLMHHNGVRAYNEEGRSFVRRSPERYDVILIHGVDTFAALNAGAYVLAENYLYTVNAVQDYVNSLSDDGILCISRWFHYAETPRLVAVSLEALSAMGIEHPEQHILMHVDFNAFATILIKRTPFSPEETAKFKANVAKWKKTLLYPVEQDDMTLREQRVIATYVEKRAKGEQTAYTDQLKYNITPVYDDSPFFFNFDRAADLFRIGGDTSVPDLVRGHWPSFTLFSLLAFSVVLVAVFMIAPLIWQKNVQVDGFPLWLIYFCCLGVSFIFVEIALMQRFALVLGHPSRSLALVLAGLLFFAGVGSFLRGIIKLPFAASLALLVAMICVAAYGYPYVLSAVLGWSLAGRAVVTLLLVAPLGILMGMPFPTGLGLVSARSEGAVPWMWGVNGGTTVVGSVLAIVIAIWVNFTTVFLLAALGYLIALVTYLLLKARYGYGAAK